jgi:exoribonuclease II
MLRVTTLRALWRYDKALLFTNQPEVDFGITHVEQLAYVYMPT